MKTFLSSLGVGTFLRLLFGIRLGCLRQYSPRDLSIMPSLNSVLEVDFPTIALVTPSFNQAKFVSQTIKSVIDQNYPRLHYVIQDACSKDGTEGVLKSFDDFDFDINIEPDLGQADALNRGFGRTSTDVMAYLNSDDLMLPGTLHFVAKYFRDHPSVDVIYGNRLIIDEMGREIGRWILPEHDPQLLRFVDYVPQESMFWRRRIWECVGSKFDTRLRFAMDWDLILRFMDCGAKFQHVPKLFGVFRAHRNQKSQADFRAYGAKEMAALRLTHEVNNLSSLKKLWLHCCYLYRHVKVDNDWQRFLGQGRINDKKIN